MKKPFQFKQFTVHQDRCAMKVGTDGVLLGAWTSLDGNPNSILDIGAGTGLVALMLAQRSAAETIDAVELNADAHGQCVANFESSPWADRLFCYHVSLQEFADEIEETYDLIVSNPPFFEAGVINEDHQRHQARNNSSLPFEELFQAVEQLLSPLGSFSLIVPFEKQSEIMELAQGVALFPNRITHVKGNPTTAIKRSLIQFSRHETFVTPDILTIELKRHQYTTAYTKLTEAYYLKM